ncbi:putative membrane protein [Prochlorococcus sp. SS52]|nr:putative membrane protein [Prochlorococcus marinus str. SS35]KGG33281.1 putative membrane protein [Prochlorococcus marinus str. SS51]KGG35612.1 putative membrane protein [Prochlorococcus sp. SS52]
MKGFLYISAWVVSWLLFSSIINAGFITTNVYEAGGKGGILTLFISAIIAIAGAFSLYKEVFPNDLPKSK